MTGINPWKIPKKADIFRTSFHASLPHVEKLNDTAKQSMERPSPIKNSSKNDMSGRVLFFVYRSKVSLLISDFGPPSSEIKGQAPFPSNLHRLDQMR